MKENTNIIRIRVYNSRKDDFYYLEDIKSKFPKADVITLGILVDCCNTIDNMLDDSFYLKTYKQLFELGYGDVKSNGYKYEKVETFINEALRFFKMTGIEL